MRDILNSHSVTALKKEISKTNIKGYSKMKKAEVVSLMLKHKQRFSHIKHAEKKSTPKVEKPKTTAPKEAPKKKKLIKITKAQKARTEAKATNFLSDIEQKGKAVAEKTKGLSRSKMFSKLEKASLFRYKGGDDGGQYTSRNAQVYVDHSTGQVYDSKEDFEKDEYSGKKVIIPQGRGKKRRKGIAIGGHLWGEGGAYGYTHDYLKSF